MVRISAVGEGAIGPCQHMDGCRGQVLRSLIDPENLFAEVPNQIELTRENCCGGGPSPRFGCGHYFCLEHMSQTLDIFSQWMPTEDGNRTTRTKRVRLCDACYEELGQGDVQSGSKGPGLPGLPGRSRFS